MNLTYRGQNLRAINLYDLCANRARVEGGGRGADFSRLFERVADAIPQDVTAETAQLNQVHIHWVVEATRKLRAGTDQYRYLVEVQGMGEIWLTCQRCLQPVLQSIHLDRIFELVDNEDQVSEAPLDDDEVDVIVGSERFDLIELVEDEILLSLPLAPKHADCQAYLQAEKGKVDMAKSDSLASSGKPNPFASLAGISLKK